MTKTMRLTRGADKADMRGYPSFKDDEKFIFYSLEGNGPKEERGKAVEVTNDQAEEMLTHPTLVFEEVTAEQAEADTFRVSLGRDMFGNSVHPKTGQIISDLHPQAIPAETITQVMSPQAEDAGAPTPPEDIRASVQATMKEEEARAAEAAKAEGPKDSAGKRGK